MTKMVSTQVKQQEKRESMVKTSPMIQQSDVPNAETNIVKMWHNGEMHDPSVKTYVTLFI